MKILVTYYSRTGLTRRIATIIASKLSAQDFDVTVDEIVDKVDRSGALGYIAAGKAATLKKLTEITFEANPKDYDLIILGSPVWAWTMSTAVRTYITQHKDVLSTKKLAFFATQSSDGADKTFLHMKEIIGLAPKATMTINAKDFRSDVHEKKVLEFVNSF